MANLDLNKLRDTILSNRSTGQDLPVRADRKVMVDNRGRIMDHNTVDGTADELSEVHQGTFA